MRTNGARVADAIVLVVSGDMATPKCVLDVRLGELKRFGGSSGGKWSVFMDMIHSMGCLNGLFVRACGTH